MSYVVVLTFDAPGSGRQVRTFGPYLHADGAERARRRIHFDAIQRPQFSRLRTYMAEIEKEREL